MPFIYTIPYAENKTKKLTKTRIIFTKKINKHIKLHLY